jgi:hypothetical protein
MSDGGSPLRRFIRWWRGPSEPPPPEPSPRPEGFGDSGWETPVDAMKHADYRFDRLEDDLRELQREIASLRRDQVVGLIALIGAIVATGIIT